FSRARLHQFAVGAEDAAKSDVMKIGGVIFSPSDRENLFEMQNLGRADHVPNGIGLQIVDPVINRCQIGGGVIVAAIAFANDARLIRQLGNIAEENADRTLADFSQPTFEQPINHRWQPVVIKTFAADDVVMNVE